MFKTAEKEFKNSFDSLSCRHSTYDVFADFLDFALMNLDLRREYSAQVDFYKKYPDDEEQKAFASMLLNLGILSDDDGQGFYDYLGSFYEENLSHGHNGQFFTPIPLCDMIAQMSIGEDSKDGQTVADPACGAGRLLLAAGKINRNLIFYATDIDMNCVKMTVINLLLNSLRGVVYCGDTLRMQFYDAFEVDRVKMAGKYVPVFHQFTPTEQETTLIKEAIKNTNPLARMIGKS